MKRHMSIQWKFSLNHLLFADFIFMSKCRKVFKALKINITKKTIKFKFADQFDSKRGQSLKMQFRRALKGPNLLL